MKNERNFQNFWKWKWKWNFGLGQKYVTFVSANNIVVVRVIPVIKGNPTYSGVRAPQN